MKTITHTPVLNPIVWTQLSGLLALTYVGRHTMILSPSATLATETYDKAAHWHNYLKKFIAKFHTPGHPSMRHLHNRWF